MSKRILLIGPLPDPTTGLSLSNQVLVDQWSAQPEKMDLDYINTSIDIFDEAVGQFSLLKARKNLELWAKFPKIRKADVVYMTIGQSFMGVLKFSLFVAVASLLGKKKVFHLHGNMLLDNYQEFSGWKRFLARQVLKAGNKSLVLSPSLKRNFLPFMPESQIEVQHNFIEGNLILTPAEIEKKLINIQGVRLVFLSNLMTEKGIFYFLEAIGLLKEKGIKIEVRIAGNTDPLLKDRLLAEMGSHSEIEYLGVVRGEKKKDLLLWGNMFVFPSYFREGLPLSILEAMATGNAVISTRHTSLEDYFDQESISYVDQQNAEQIADAIVALNEKEESKRLEVLRKNWEYTKELTVENFCQGVEQKISIS